MTYNRISETCKIAYSHRGVDTPSSFSCIIIITIIIIIIIIIIGVIFNN